jgi:GDPmannose 4,6-dehydratase
LTEILLEKDYKVYGLKRRSSSLNTERIDHLYQDKHENPKLELVYGDVCDSGSVNSFIGDIKPDLCFFLSAQSHVKVSFDIPDYTFDCIAGGCMRVLETIRKNSPQTRILNSNSSECFGSSSPPQNELTTFHPRSPYAVAKAASHYATINYREAYNLFAVNSICFNFESPRRLETFVTRKITRAATRIKEGLQEKLYLGNLEAKRDWQHAKDAARAMYTILTANEPDDYVIAKGEMHSVKEFAEIVFSKLSLNWKDHVIIDPKYFRPSEVDALCGDATKLKKKFNFQHEYTFEQLVNEMIEYDLELAKKEKLLQNVNRKIL